MIKIENGLYRQDDFSLHLALDIPQNSFCAVLGPSGAGKSTLLNIIAGFENLISGKIEIDGADMSNMPPAKRPISMVFQDHNVFAHLNVRDNVALGIDANLKLDANQDAQVGSALSRVGLENYAARLPGQLSGGERQRVALARVLVRQSKILLLDEPFAALDPGLRKDMLLLVREITQERNLTTLLVTHQPEEAKLAAQLVVFVGEGQVHRPEKTAEFFNSYNPAIRNYLGYTN
jgi:thiamine transport system ATP-binding protein